MYPGCHQTHDLPASVSQVLVFIVCSFFMDMVLLKSSDICQLMDWHSLPADPNMWVALFLFLLSDFVLFCLSVGVVFFLMFLVFLSCRIRFPSILQSMCQPSFLRWLM